MDQRYLDEIQARCAAATPGPWEVGDGSERHFFNGKSAVVAAPLRVVADRATYGHIGKEHSGFDEQTYADMSLIAHARQDIPALLAEVERLTALELPQWISAEHEVPVDGDELVLVVANGKPCKNIKLIGAYELAEYNDIEGWILQEYPDAEGIEVTHWMPLPDLPEGV